MAVLLQRIGWAIWVLVSVAWLAACNESSLVQCGDLLCPNTTVCLDNGGEHQCAAPAEVEACATLLEGAQCNIDGVSIALTCHNGACLPLTCGDKRVGFGEVCDDGNQVGGDGCSANCKSDESCGNHIVDELAGETCDDQNQDDSDQCHSNCKIPRCGDGIIDSQQNGEACDDGAGNSNAADAHCRPNCQLQRCGDHIIDQGELCDDGNLASLDGCRGDCKSDETCGNGVIDSQKGEACDEGAANSNMAGALCNANCQLPNCGDGIPGPLEQCDLGAANSNLPNAACRTNCQFARCNDGIIDSPSELCDDGNNASSDGCSADCRSDETCGNGIVDSGEECDDHNRRNGDGCQMDCRRPRCGDGVVDHDNGEACDQGASNSNDPDVPCRPNCQASRCGDGVLDVAHLELCDDGNLASLDGCRGDCKSDETCGNGIVDPQKGEACDEGVANSNSAGSPAATARLIHSNSAMMAPTIRTVRMRIAA